MGLTFKYSTPQIGMVVFVIKSKQKDIPMNDVTIFQFIKTGLGKVICNIEKTLSTSLFLI